MKVALAISLCVLGVAVGLAFDWPVLGAFIGGSLAGELFYDAEKVL